MSLEKPKRVKNKALIKEVMTQRCAAAGPVMHEACMGEVCAHHVTGVGAGGQDVRSNLMPLCVKHHVPSIHDLGNRWMCEKYPSVRAWLESWDRWDILDFVDQLDLLIEKKEKKLQIK